MAVFTITFTYGPENLAKTHEVRTREKLKKGFPMLAFLEALKEIAGENAVISGGDTITVSGVADDNG